MSSKLAVAIFIGVLSVGLASQSGLAQTGSLERDEIEHPPPYDPWEPVNQKIFWFNLRLDEYVLRPVATGYSKVVPEPAR